MTHVRILLSGAELGTDPSSYSWRLTLSSVRGAWRTDETREGLVKAQDEDLVQVLAVLRDCYETVSLEASVDEVLNDPLF